MLGFLSPRPKGESKSTTNQPAGAREHHHCNKTPAEGELYSKIVVRPSSSATNRTKEPTKPKESTSDDRQLAIQLEREEATARVSDLENKLKQAQQEILSLKQKVCEQQHEITVQRDELFNVKPTEQITDAQVSEKYEHLCESIRNWVDDEISAFQDRKGDLSMVENVSTDLYMQDVIMNCSNALECLVEGYLHSLLQGTIFGHHVQFWGLDSRGGELIAETAYGLYHLDPPRDSITVQSWRSEAIKSIATLPWVKDRRQVKLKMLMEHLLEEMNKRFPFVRLGSNDLARMHKSMVKPAAELEASIHMSSTEYCFSKIEFQASNSSLPPVKLSVLAQKTCIDTGTRKKIKASHFKSGNPQDHIGGLVYSIAPALLRGTGQSVLQLHQERVLVHLDTPREQR